MRNSPGPSEIAADRKMPMALFCGALILVIFIGYLLYFNFRNHNALVASSLRSFQLDVEKHSASMGYFFIERKYDIRALAASQEILSYYTNKDMGMSEAYGLKVNLFLISDLMNKIVDEKIIDKDPVYLQLTLADMDGKILVNAGPHTDGRVEEYEKVPQYRSSEPVFRFGKSGSTAFLKLSTPVFYKNRVVGQVITTLNLKTLYDHFMGNHAHIASKGFVLTDENGTLLCAAEDAHCTATVDLSPTRAVVVNDSEDFFYIRPDDHSPEIVMFTRMLIPSSPLYLSAWVRKKEIFGTLAPWQIYLSGAFFAFVMLIGLGLLLRFSFKNSLLRARYEASEKQQQLLEIKNRQLNEEIHLRETAEKNLEIQKSVRIRSDRLRSLGEMAAGIAHELNQPLTGIRGLSELIQFGITNHSIGENKISEIVSRILGQTDRMVHIINHVRLFAREAGNTDSFPIDLNKTIASAMTLLSAQFTSHGLTITEDMAPSSLVIKANPYSLEEVIINIMNNARHAVESKKEAAGRDFKPVIGIKTTRINGSNGDDGRVVLEISDNGSGMTRETAEKIFNPFFTTKDPLKGTGLGLSICKSIVESYGGRIDFSTKEDEGTTFKISFRCSAAEMSGDSELPAMKTPKLST